MSVLRFFARYRWELLLFFGIPAAAWFAWVLAVLPIDVFQFPLFDNADPDFLESCVRVAVSTALLGISYFYVRRQERWFLSLIWRYLLALEVLTVPLIVIWAAWLSDLAVSGISGSVWSISISLVYVVALLLPVELWFARQASRSSLAHAFFLVLVSGLIAGGGNPAQGFVELWMLKLTEFRATMGTVTLLVSFTSYIAAGLLGVWLLSNFERRGPVFRRRTIYGMLAFEGYLWLHAWLVVMAVFGWSALTYLDEWLIWRAFLVSFGTDMAIIALTLALVYLVRVRQPLPQSEKV